jgi:hypothetical protein
MLAARSSHHIVVVLDDADGWLFVVRRDRISRAIGSFGSCSHCVVGRDLNLHEVMHFVELASSDE